MRTSKITETQMRDPPNESLRYYVPQKEGTKLWLLTDASKIAFFAETVFSLPRSAGRARDPSSKIGFYAEEVLGLALPGSPVRNGLPLFRDRTRAESLARELTTSGTTVRVVAAPRPELLTDLLDHLQDFGVTQMYFDLSGAAHNPVTIERAIIGLYLLE